MTEDQNLPNSDANRSPFYRLSVRQYLKMIDAGVFPRHVRLELLGGRLYENPDRKRPRPLMRRKINPTNRSTAGSMSRMEAHDYSVPAVASSLHRLPHDGWLISEQRSITLGASSHPTPDVVVLQGPVSHYKDHAPVAPDIALIVEVAGASYALDHGVKCQRYATCGIPIYWIVNIPSRRVEVFHEPTGQGRSAAYRQSATFVEGQSVPFLIDRQEIGEILVAELLP